MIHIGPQKTGSTAIQNALHQQRELLAEHDVHYAGQGERPRKAAWAVRGTAPRGRRLPDESAWLELCAEVRDAGDRTVVISNEDFGRSDDAVAGRIVEGLGCSRPHVVMVARSYDRLLPSQWQQRVRAGEGLRYEKWLEYVLDDDNAGKWRHRSVWRPHDTVELVRRWGAHSGPENVTVVVSDDRDRKALPRGFELLLGLPEDSLQVELVSRQSNRSITHPESELVRRVNQLFQREGWGDDAYHELVQLGVVHGMRTAKPSSLDAPLPALPEWAAARVEELSTQRVAGLRELGVHVVGDLDALQPSSVKTVEGPLPQPELISVDAAFEAIAGALQRSQAREKKLRRQVKKLRRASKQPAPKQGITPPWRRRPSS